jgi:hypothetical protein
VLRKLLTRRSTGAGRDREEAEPLVAPSVAKSTI